MGFKSVVPFRGELSTNGENWITLGGGKVFSQAGATIRSPAGRWSMLTIAAAAAAADKVEFHANGVKVFELTIPNTEGFFTNTTDYYDAAEGDEVAIVFVRNNAFSRDVRPTGSIQFEAEAGTGPVAFHQATRSNTYATGTGGGSVLTLTLGQAYNSTTATALSTTPVSFQSSGVLSHFRMVRTQNLGNVAVVATVHINGAPTAISISLASGFTGTAENTTDTATVGPDDVVTIRCVETTTGGTYNIDQACLRFTSTDGAYDLFNATIGQDLAAITTGTVWAAAGGGTAYASTNTGLVLPHAVEVSDTRAVTGATANLEVTFGLFSNGQWSNMVVAPSAATITEVKSADTATRIGAGLRVALGKQGSVGPSGRLMGAQAFTLRESPLQTSYDNPGGSGERRQGIYYAWYNGDQTHNGGYAHAVLGPATDSTFYPAATGECSLYFDFVSPRLLDEVRVITRLSANAGSWSLEASHDLIDWIELSPSSVKTGNVLTWAATNNVSAYRYYRVRRALSGSSSNHYWFRAEFKIDDNQPDDGWFSSYSFGDRSSFVAFPQTDPENSMWLDQAAAPQVVSLTNATATTSARFSAGSSGYCTFVFPEKVNLTGFMWWWGGPVVQGVYALQGKNDLGVWEDLTAPFNFEPQPRNILKGQYSPVLKLEFSNPNSYQEYRFVTVSGSRITSVFSSVLNLKVSGNDVPPVSVSPLAGSLILTGSVPEIIASILVNPIPAALVITGETPTVYTETIISPAAAYLTLTGQTPIISIGVYASPSAADLVITGQEPAVYTQSGAVASQVAMLSLSEVVPNAVASQIAALALAQPPAPPMRASQVAAMALAEVVPDVCASQAAILVLGYASKCVTQNCQIWTITRRDGKVYRYTSLDRNLTYGGHVYKACGSMDPSASQNGATLGEVGSQSLTGLITDDGITEAELFGGLFDDAFVTTYLIDWSAPTIPPRRLASGWVGRVSQGPAFHTMEVLSVGARLEQTALVQVVSPSCRWQFGDSRCGVNVEAMKLPATIRRVINRGDLVLNISTPPDDGRIWASGRIRFLDGPCAGMVCEYKGVDFATGQIVLWSPAGLLPSAGNAVEVLPGCDLTRGGGCKAYNNRINFGGFADVPGADAILETPDAKI